MFTVINNMTNAKKSNSDNNKSKKPDNLPQGRANKPSIYEKRYVIGEITLDEFKIKKLLDAQFLVSTNG